MQRIIATIKLGETSPQVANLQDALVLLARENIRPLETPNRPTSEEVQELTKSLVQERTQSLFGKATSQLVVYFQLQQGLGEKLRGVVEEKTAEVMNRLLRELGALDENSAGEFTVKGRVTLTNGMPAVGLIVRARALTLRRFQTLRREAITDSDGRYAISYSREQFSQTEKGNTGLVIRVFLPDRASDSDEPVVESPTLFNAPLVAEVNLTVPVEVIQPPTLFENIGRTVIPHIGSLKVEELEEDKTHKDLTFLSGVTGMGKAMLGRFVLAQRLALQGIQAEFWFALLGGSFFQFAENQSLKVQASAILDSLASLDAAAVRKLLNRAFSQKEISEAFLEKVADWTEGFLGFLASHSVSTSGTPSFVKSALDHAGIEGAEKQERFARLFNDHKALTPKLLATLKQDSSFTQTEISDLQTSFVLTELTKSDFSVVKMLKEEFDVRQPEKIRLLAKKSESEWVNLVKEKHAAGDIKLPIEVGEVAGQKLFPAVEVYGKTLERQFRQAYPTTAFAGGLERALQNGGAQGLSRAQDLSRFLDDHEEFELLKTPVDEFFKTRQDFQALAKDENFRLEVKAVQRVFKLAPTFEATDALLADDLHSSQKIYLMGQSEFVRKYADRPGFTAESANLAWNGAANTYAAVLTIVPELMSYVSGPRAAQYDSTALSNFPNWDNLFNAGDLCDCESCRSVLGPAAYFADLLKFLKDRGQAKDILFNRRPDLGYTDLTCKNASTRLPYIDVVCEVLEDAVAAGDNDIELLGFVNISPDVIKATTVNKTIKQFINFGSDNTAISFSQVDPEDPYRWVMRTDTVTYLLKKKGPPDSNYFAEVLRNTTASAAELQAYPQYVNPEAYAKLRTAQYPFSLPFDLYAQEVRATFQKTNFQRWELMRTFRGTAGPNNPTEGDVAAEYFGICSSAKTKDPSEKSIILIAKPTAAEQKILWSGAAEPADLTIVTVFLQRTGLDYNGLLTLLTLKFINPQGDITIQPLDASCDTDRKVIQALDVTALDRIHRFLRLWRKLPGWNMWELDLVIGYIGGGSLDEPFLINLFYFCEVRKKLGGTATIEQVCALFGDLNTETRFTKPYEPRGDALYQSLFLNKTLLYPLDPAFQIHPITSDLFETDSSTQDRLPPLEMISAHMTTIQAALGSSETDLLIFKHLTKASDGMPYMSDDMIDPHDPHHLKNGLNLANLSFLWRHAWLAKMLKFKAEDWRSVLKVLGKDVAAFSSPKAAWDFLETVEQLKSTGFTPDELNWLLTADRTAKTAAKETDAARVFAALRKELQSIRDQYRTDQYTFLTEATNEAPLIGLLTTLLQTLHRDDIAVSVFLKTLRGQVQLEADAQALPPAFTFPQEITDASPSGSGIPISYQTGVVRFTGLMSDVQRATLLDDASPALKALRAKVTVQGGLPASVTFPAAIPIHYENAQLHFTGLMTDGQRTTLLGLSTVAGNAAYRTAIEDLYQQSFNVVTAYQRVIEELHRQSLNAGTDYVSLEKEVSFSFAFPATITGVPNAIPIRFDQVLRFTGVMTDAQHTTLIGLASGLTGSAKSAYLAAIDRLFKQSGTAAVTGLPADFGFPPAITDAPSNIPIRYDQLLRFTGVMTAAQKTALLKVPELVGLTDPEDSAYQAAIKEFFDSPHLAVKFYEPVFTAPLARQPLEVDFAALPDQLAEKIYYDAEQRLLRFSGFMSGAEKKEILILSPDADYVTAVESLAAQPHQPMVSPDRVWLTDNDLDIAKLENSTYPKRLAHAIQKALNYLSSTSAENAVVRECSAQLGLTEAPTRRLLTAYAVVPISPTPTPPAPTTRTLMAHLTDNFTIDSTTFDSWFWANRVAAILKKWKITLKELDKIDALKTTARLLDFSTLPLEEVRGTGASLERFLRTHRLLKLRDNLPETKITLLDVLDKLNTGVYAAKTVVPVQGLPEGFTTFPIAITAGRPPIPIQNDAGVFIFTGQMTTSQRSTLLTDASLPKAVRNNVSYKQAIEELFRNNLRNFAGDVGRLNEAWLGTDVVALIASLDLNYPTDYLLAESWERLRRAFAFLENLNAGADTVKTFAAPAMTDTQATTVKELLRSKFGAETWLTVSAEIQDALRERKRDALAAYLLNHTTPAEPPSGKWENMDDLYAYYLLDVEMSSCKLTSRLVQASGSVQLFVQRCFMGLEPQVVADADHDSAWRWWKWMRKYQVWVANRKVFLWPENWIEPELKKDRSPFFKDLENELLQNDINQETVKAAFSNYLEKLGRVAQLEIAGFFQEDDGTTAIVHIFGRTAGAAPQYYYRRYDYRQWSPWEKVELDIQGDYLIPAVINKRLFLFWPVFTEKPKETKNKSVKMPSLSQSSFTPDQTEKTLELTMALSEYRQGKWTPKTVSTDSVESPSYSVEITKRNYRFLFIDDTPTGRPRIQYDGYSVADNTEEALRQAVVDSGTVETDASNDQFAAEASLKKAISAFVLIQTADRLLAEVINEINNNNWDWARTNTPLISTIVTQATTALGPDAPGADSDAPLDFNDFQDALTRLSTALDDAHTTPNDDNKANAKKVDKDAADASAEALRIATNFKDASADDVRSARKALKKARALVQKALDAQTNFLVDKTHQAAHQAVFTPGAFEISGCAGVPEKKTDSPATFELAIYPEPAAVGDVPAFLKWVERAHRPRVTGTAPSDFTLVRPAKYDTVVLLETPELFTMSAGWHLSYIDKIGLLSSPSEHKIGTGLPFFYADKKRIFFVLPSTYAEAPDATWIYYPKIKMIVEDNIGASLREIVDSSMSQYSPYVVALFEGLIKNQSFHFKNFYHPFVCDFARFVNNPLEGIPALMRRETQLMDKHFMFEQDYHPSGAVVKFPPEYDLIPDCYPREVVDFTPDGAYSPYNWELFFHAPLLIANALSKNQRFEEARDWYHFIFNPIGTGPARDGSPMSKYWITKPFYQTTDGQAGQYVQQRIDNILRMLAGDTSVPGYSSQAKTDLETQVLDWRTNPFEPHRIANYRTVAYQKTVVMKYLDNLLAWGDNLFRQNSMESINEATQLYVLAAEILGPRPKSIPPQAKPPVASFNELEANLDKFSNELVQVENLVPMLSNIQFMIPDLAPLPTLPTLYFCVPQNDKMLDYWDAVAARLDNIRHCRNIDGVISPPDLFEPSIDPAALVKAVAAGLDLSSALADLNAPLPLYRFNVLLQKANEVCTDVKALGGALLAALEKNDAEDLGQRRQTQEIQLLEAVKTVRETQVEEAKENLASVKQSKELAEMKKRYYESKEFMNALENASAALAGGALGVSGVLSVNDALASIFFLLPSFNIGVSGFGGSPQVTAQWGSENIAKSIQSANSALQHAGSVLSQSSSMVATTANYQRRKEEWDFQKDLAYKESEQLDKSIAAAELRIAIAESELANHVIQMENARDIDAFMRSKYTNQELYQWQIGQVAGVYFQNYKLAYDLAKRAERCFRFEVGLSDSSFITFGYWDSLKKGLMSGEKLQYDLRRLENAYLEQNRREFELNKHVSLALLDPLALVKLRETGRCFFRLPEEIFDLDYPGHYFRRIKSVSLTLPCVVGPYTTIACTLRLLKNSIRMNTANGDNMYPRNTDTYGLPADDPRFMENNIPVKAIAASNGQNDGGMFELSFRDERYLPFEGAGAVSEWSLELFNDLPSNNPDFGKPLRQFDYRTISDAILHIKYTAREDAGVFKNGAVSHLRNYFSQDNATPALRMFNVRQEFPTQWHRFLNPDNKTTGNVLEIDMSADRFQFRDQDKTLKVTTVSLLARCTDRGNYSVVLNIPRPAPLPAGSDTYTLAHVTQYGGLHFSYKNASEFGITVVAATDPPVKWQLTMTRPGGKKLQKDPVKQVMEVEDLFMVVGYQWS